MPTSTHFGIKLESWKARMDEASVKQRIYDRSQKCLTRIGAVLMRAARKKIKRRIVTAGMRQRLSAANTRGDKTAARRIAATIQRRESTVSAPGDPPIAHVPDHPVASIRAIYFAVQPRIVVVGPVKANFVVFRGSNRSSVPEILEKGGTVTIEEKRVRFRDGRTSAWARRDRRRSRREYEEFRMRTANYKSRPFMGPTLIEHQEKTRTIISAVFRSNAG